MQICMANVDVREPVMSNRLFLSPAVTEIGVQET